jgi:hypothetical protein
MHMKLFGIVLFFGMLVTYDSVAQEVFRGRPSPLAIAATRYKDAYVKVVYSQPLKRDREVFGKLVPYGQVWRTGANEATEVTLTRDVMINNQIVKAGTYSLFTIPNADQWTIILNNELGLWGAYNYNERMDVLRFNVPVSANPTFYEAFTISFDQRNEMADLLMMWDKTIVKIPLKFIN